MAASGVLCACPLVQELRAAVVARAARWEAHRALWAARAAVLEGRAQLTVDHVRGLFAEVRRREERGGFVIDPRVVFSGDARDDGFGGRRGAMAIVALFAARDAVGRPTGGVAVGDAAPIPLLPGTVRYLHTKHREQSQRFLDFYKPKCPPPPPPFSPALFLQKAGRRFLLSWAQPHSFVSAGSWMCGPAT
jgi:hypothetical protein